MLAFSDLTPFSLNALLLLFTAFAGILVILRRPRPGVLAFLLALAAGGGYAFLMQGRMLPWWGLQGDEAYIGAAITKAWHGIFWSDFYYTSLPPFYPPLYFWITGAIGKLIGFSPIGAMNAGVASGLFLTPLVIFYGIKTLPAHLFEIEQKNIQSWFAFFAAGAIALTSNWVGFLSKPFEFTTAALAIIFVLHLAVLARGLHHRPLLATITLGIIGALIVWTYYLWMIFSLLALAMIGMRYAPAARKIWYGALAKVFAIAALLSAPFWITLLRGIFSGGEAWQMHWFMTDEFTLAPTLITGLPALVALLGIGTAIASRKQVVPFVLSMLLLAPGVWYAMNMAMLLFAERSILPTKAMHFIGAYALALLAAWALASVYAHIKNTTHAQGALTVIWILFVLAVPTGVFAARFGNEHILKLGQSKETHAVVSSLKSRSDLAQKTALVSEQPLIVGQVPLNVFISFNPHFTHPSAHWSERHSVVFELVHATSSRAFTRVARENRFAPIDLLILSKHKKDYQLYFWLDTFPSGGKDETLSFPQTLVGEKDWKKLFENKQFAVFEFQGPNETRDAGE